MLLVKKTESVSNNRKYNAIYSERMYGKLYDRSINITAKARDYILPHRFVNIDIDADNGCIHLFPTDNENTGYKLTIPGNGRSMARINYCYAQKVLALPEKTEMPITLNDDGSLTMRITCAEGD